MLLSRFYGWVALNSVASAWHPRPDSMMASRKLRSPFPPPEQPSSPLATTADGSVILRVRVKPGAKFTQLVGGLTNLYKTAVYEFEDPLGVRVAAPPREGACNEALVEFVGNCLKVKKRGVALISGHKSREKVLSITGVTMATAEELLRKQLQLDAA